jgi:polar amino acid transport system substrate-binding protein
MTFSGLVPPMKGLIRILLYTTIAAVSSLGARASSAESLRLVTDFYSGSSDDEAPGYPIEVLRQVFAAMGQEFTFERFPTQRVWRLVPRGERDGMFATFRTPEKERVCSFPDEPLDQVRWVFFVRTADIGKLTFSSFDDLIGHDVGANGGVPGVFEQPTLSLELWKFLREHHNLVETRGTVEAFRMLAAGRIDYAVASLPLGTRVLAEMGLSGEIAPLSSRSVMDEGVYVCFSKARVSPSLVHAFSQELKRFKQTETFLTISRKYAVHKD